jgi:hypothetical protein
MLLLLYEAVAPTSGVVGSHRRGDPVAISERGVAPPSARHRQITQAATVSRSPAPRVAAALGRKGFERYATRDSQRVPGTGGRRDMRVELCGSPRPAAETACRLLPKSCHTGRGFSRGPPEEPRKRLISGAFRVRPRGLEPPRTLQSTRPSTLRVYQFRHRRVGGQYSLGSPDRAGRRGGGGRRGRGGDLARLLGYSVESVRDPR